jgi:hypothetical protein
MVRVPRKVVNYDLFGTPQINTVYDEVPAENATKEEK